MYVLKVKSQQGSTVYLVYVQYMQAREQLAINIPVSQFHFFLRKNNDHIAPRKPEWVWCIFFLNSMITKKEESNKYILDFI